MIVILLLVIIFILAPWLIGVVVGIAALYGVWVIFAAGLAAAALLLIGAALGFRALFFPKKTRADALAASNKEFNRKYVEQAEKERLARVEIEIAVMDQAKKLLDDTKKVSAKAPAPRSARMITCPHCTESIPKYGLWCPRCGKDPRSEPKPII